MIGENTSRVCTCVPSEWTQQVQIFFSSHMATADCFQQGDNNAISGNHVIIRWQKMAGLLDRHTLMWNGKFLL